MTVITVSRKLGSDGDYIAKQTAQMLGYQFVDKKFIGDVLCEYGLVEFNWEYDHLPSFWEKFDAQEEARRDVLVDMLNRVIRAVAQRGNVVILGRSGYVVLGAFGDVLNARIQAPEPFRVAQVAAREKVSLEEAKKIVAQGDKVRAAFVESFYGVDWTSANGFDLVINRAKISPELTINWLVSAARKIEQQEPAQQPTAAALQVDTNLMKTIAKEFHRATSWS
ncbi:MAG TPA: cytidylate kinase-like family protein [Anaerolineae bacterium]|nr:cytidylate kinase-like family protein [Anaerolineae bacterium]